MKKSPLRVIIVGAGFFGTKRIAACIALPEAFTVVGVVDPAEDRRNSVAQGFRVPTFPDIPSVTGRADAAIIATPNAYHADASISAMKHGMHVLCEKPLAPTVRDAKRIIAAARRYKKIVKTGSNHRFFHTVQKAKELYDRGAIGTLLFFKGSIGTNGTRVSRKWFWDPAISGGGTFIDNGCHLLDIARMFMGDFSHCTASMTTNLWKQTQVEDVGTAIYKTKDNRQAVITSSWIQWAGYLHIELWGESGYIIIDSTMHDTTTIGGKDGTCTIYDYSNEPKDSYHRELLYFKQCIETHSNPSPNAQDGEAVITMIHSAYQASKTKTWVHIPSFR